MSYKENNASIYNDHIYWSSQTVSHPNSNCHEVDGSRKIDSKVNNAKKPARSPDYMDESNEQIQKKFRAIDKSPNNGEIEIVKESNKKESQRFASARYRKRIRNMYSDIENKIQISELQNERLLHLNYNLKEIIETIVKKLLSNNDFENKKTQAFFKSLNLAYATDCLEDEIQKLAVNENEQIRQLLNCDTQQTYAESIDQQSSVISCISIENQIEQATSDDINNFPEIFNLRKNNSTHQLAVTNHQSAKDFDLEKIMQVDINDLVILTC